jgi:hypothetical protein
VTFSAFDKKDTRQSSRVLFLHGKTGGDAICTEKNLQSEALASLYERAASSSAPITCNLDVSLLIARNGRTQSTLPLPGGKTIGRDYGIGLQSPCNSPLIESVEQSVDPAGVWVTFSALDKKDTRQSSRVLFLHGKTGGDAFRTEQDLQSEALASLYEQAANSSGPITCNLDVSLLIARNGLTQKILPLPGAQTIGGNYGIGLPKDLRSQTVTRILHLSDDLFHVTFSAVTAAEKAVSRQVIVSSRGIVKPERSTAATEIAKGHTLDRYVSHLHAATQTNAHRNPLYEGSPLTGERFMPNIVSGQTIVHSKWGNRGEDVLDYIRKYARLRLWNSDLIDAAHLIASTSYADELQAALVDLQSKAQVPQTIITDVVTWGENTLGATRQQIVAELERIETMASLGNLAWLGSRRYDPMLESTSYGIEHTSALWEERVKALATTDVIIEVLEKHAAHHSLYWERAYHLELARHCSYLIDCVLPSASLTEKNKDKARRIVYELYPALKSYPDAWRYINDETTARLEDDDDGDGSPPRLTPFNLEQELLRRGLSIPVTRVVDRPLVIDAGEAPDLGPDVNQILESSGSIEVAITTVIAALHASSENARAKTLKVMVARIASAICNVKFTDSLPEQLLEAKNASDKNGAFLDAIKQLPGKSQLKYELGSKSQTISVSKLREMLAKLQRQPRSGGLE